MTRHTLLALTLTAPLLAADPRGEAGLLSALKKLAAPLDPAKTANLDAREARELLEKNAREAMRLVAVFERDHARSKALNDARLEALKAVSHAEGMTTDAAALAVAKRLREATPKGSDHAAQADLFLVGADIRLTLRGVKAAGGFKEAWGKNAAAFRKKIAGYLDDHPKYAPAADALRGLMPVLELAGDTVTRDLVLERVARNLPDHPLAKGAALRKAVGQPFDFRFTPAGGKEMSLKDLRGKVVVVSFWASWCVPCVAEVDELKELYAKHRADGLEIIGISLDEKIGAAALFVGRHKPSWRQVIGKEARALGARYGVESVPLQLVIDREGRLHTADTEGKLPAVLGRLLGKK